MATTTNFGWETPDDTDLVKDGAAAIRTALGGVDTSFVDLKGGTTGQVLSKASNTDLDYTWITSSSSGPAFRATRTTTQSISANTTTKMEFNSETFDTDSCYDPTTNYRFTPNKAGYYQVGAMAYYYAASFDYGRIFIYKNGSNVLETDQPRRPSGSASPAFTHLIAMNGTTDYLEVYVRMDAAGTVGDGAVLNNFYATWIRGL